MNLNHIPFLILRSKEIIIFSRLSACIYQAYFNVITDVFACASRLFGLIFKLFRLTLPQVDKSDVK